MFTRVDDAGDVRYRDSRLCNICRCADLVAQRKMLQLDSPITILRILDGGISNTELWFSLESIECRGYILKSLPPKAGCSLKRSLKRRISAKPGINIRMADENDAYDGSSKHIRSKRRRIRSYGINLSSRILIVAAVSEEYRFSSLTVCWTTLSSSSSPAGVSSIQSGRFLPR